jgi:VanZ family protein
MRRYAELRGFILLVCGLGILLLTTLPGSVPLIRRLFSWMGYFYLGDKLGHAGLFALLVAVGYLALLGWFSPPRALVIATICALLMGTATEAYQMFVAGRAATLADLTANWLGALLMQFALFMLWQLYVLLNDWLRQRAHNRAF